MKQRDIYDPQFAIPADAYGAVLQTPDDVTGLTDDELLGIVKRQRNSLFRNERAEATLSCAVSTLQQRGYTIGESFNSLERLGCLSTDPRFVITLVGEAGNIATVGTSDSRASVKELTEYLLQREAGTKSSELDRLSGKVRLLVVDRMEEKTTEHLYERC